MCMSTERALEPSKSERYFPPPGWCDWSFSGWIFGNTSKGMFEWKSREANCRGEEISGPKWNTKQNVHETNSTRCLLSYCQCSRALMKIMQKCTGMIISHPCAGHGIETTDGWLMTEWHEEFFAEQHNCHSKIPIYIPSISQDLVHPNCIPLLPSHPSGVHKLHWATSWQVRRRCKTTSL